MNNTGIHASLPVATSLRAMLLAMLLAMLSMPVNAAQETAGYRELAATDRQPAPGTVQVFDFFWYGCPHCKRFEPMLAAWIENQPEDIQLVRVPAVTRQGWVHYARTYYTMRELGLPDGVHKEIFKAIHTEKRPLSGMDGLADFFEGLGISRQRFEEAYNSDAVDMQVNNAIELTRQFTVDSVPTIVVNGRYLTNPQLAGGSSKILDIVDQLVDSERQASQASQ